MIVYRQELCQSCESLGAFLVVQYGDTEVPGKNHLGETIPRRRFIGRSWFMTCQDCHGHGEVLRLYKFDGPVKMVRPGGVMAGLVGVIAVGAEIAALKVVRLARRINARAA